jgi:5-methylcytosine-specific restriction enzyme subunit McrC
MVVSSQRIPIQNIYFLLCYAWNHLQETKYAEVRSEGCDKIWDLLAKVLIRGSQQLVKRGLHRNYVLERERRVRPKGKLLLSQDIRRPTFATPMKTCEFDELSPDVLPNQIIGAAFKALSRHSELSADNRRELREASAPFGGLTPLALRTQHFRRVHLNSNMRHYRFVLNVCELIYEQSVPTQDYGVARFRDFDRDDAKMGELFEQFVRNFYMREQSTYRVSAPHVKWDVNPTESSMRGLDLLPTMKTDICMESASDKLIIDCKFYKDAFQHHHDTKKFLSGHIYQLFSYLRNQATVAGWGAVRGMLLYPTVGESIDEVVSIQGHQIRVSTIDLGQPWQAIAADLLTLLTAKAK